MDLSKFTQYLNALVSNSILPSFKTLFNQSSKEISDSIKELEGALSDDKSEAIELIRQDIKEGIAKLHKTKLAGEYAQFLNKLRFVKGDKGDMPSNEEMVAVFKPLIPEMSKGESGKNGKDGRDGIDAKPPTKKELKELIKPLIPEPKKGKDGSNGRDGLDGRDGKDGKDGSPDKPKDIVAKLESLSGDKRLDASAIKNLPVADIPLTGMLGRGVKFLRNLQDVLITSPANNDVLKYNSVTSKWVNGTASSSGHTIQDEGTPLTARTNLNFVGPNITVTDGGAGPDSTIITVSGGGDVTKVGTPVNNQIGVWTGDGTIEGDAKLTFNGSSLAVAMANASNGVTITSTTGSNEAFAKITNTGGSLYIGKNDSLGNALGVGSSYETVFYDTGNEPMVFAPNGAVALTINPGGASTFVGDVTVPDEVYDATNWNGSLEVPTKNAVRDKIESLGGGGFTWSEVTGTSQAAAINNGYITNNASLVTVTLPDTAALGSVVRVTGKGAGGWKIAQNASEQIIWNEGGVDGVNETTIGTGGYIQSNDDYDSVELICITANTTWGVLSSKGNIILA